MPDASLPNVKMSDDISDLHRRAQEKLKKKHKDKIPPVDVQNVVHELEVHQIELEMQNEELRLTQQELSASREKYFDLYDLAPVGYFSVSENGLILEANLTAAVMLGKERSHLGGQPLSRFIIKEDQDLYYLCHKQLLETRSPQVREIRMVRKDAAPLLGANRRGFGQLLSTSAKGSGLRKNSHRPWRNGPDPMKNSKSSPMWRLMTCKNLYEWYQALCDFWRSGIRGNSTRTPTTS